MDFKIPVMNCNETVDIVYDDCVNETAEAMGCDLMCTVKTAMDCQPNQRAVEAMTTWEREWKEPDTHCEPKTIRIPKQELIHKKKCLLEHDNPSIGKIYCFMAGFAHYRSCV